MQAFDELLLLQRGGTTIYAGPLGTDSNTLIDYFEALGVDPKPQGLNPATWCVWPSIGGPALTPAVGRTGVHVPLAAPELGVPSPALGVQLRHWMCVV